MKERIPKILKNAVFINSINKKPKLEARKFVAKPRLTFLGGVGTVTGSKYLLEYEHKKILIDCGLFQGLKELRLRNRSPFIIEPRDIDAILLTHAHIDHSGYIPLLVKKGFKGPVYCSKATLDLCSILLPDSGYLQEEDAKHARKWGYSKHKKPEPLYTKKDAERSLKYFKSVDFGIEYKISQDLTFQINRVGHILGAGSITVKFGNKSILFSGDIGRTNALIMKKPEQIPETDYIVVESTYGNRKHKDINPEKKLEKIINETALNGGSIIIPAFAVGRSQNILHIVTQLRKEKKIPDIPVFLDSPMSIKVTNLLEKYPNEHNLSFNESKEIYASTNFTVTPDQSKKIKTYGKPLIIISASGMISGGRILHHIKDFGTNPNNTILFPGYQALGTRGRNILEGKKEIKIHGQMIPINAKIEKLNNMSAHADYSEIIEWLSTRKKKPTKVFITHGEDESAAFMKKSIEEKFGWNCITPKYLQIEEL
ncbi:MBL fold metallo-hydrolase RNA specificity domain-containing protein [Pseudomonadota bacterium]